MGLRLLSLSFEYATTEYLRMVAGSSILDDSHATGHYSFFCFHAKNRMILSLDEETAHEGVYVELATTPNYRVWDVMTSRTVPAW